MSPSSLRLRTLLLCALVWMNWATPLAVARAAPSGATAADRADRESAANAGETAADFARTLLARAGFHPEQLAYLVVDLESGRTLRAARERTPFPPASTAKLVTAIAALEVLGGEAHLATELLLRGEVRDGVLRGDVVLRGGGDPLLDLDDLHALALALSRSGIRRVRGRFVVDDTLFPRITRITADEPDFAPYNAGIGPLVVAFNRVRLARRGKAFFTVPPLAEAVLLPPRDGSSRLRFEPAGRDGTPARWHLGVYPDGRWPKALPVRDGGLHVAALLGRFAAAYGVSLPEPRRGPTPAGARVLARVASPPLRELVRAMLWYSNNQVAEMLGLVASRRVLGRPAGDLAASASTLLARLALRVPSLGGDGARLVDHSGLSAADRLTPRALADLLRDGFSRFDLPALLPASGWSGTLGRRLLDRTLALRLWAKTGSTAYASAIAGFLLPPGKPPRIVVAAVWDPAARRAYYDASVRTAELEARARNWRERARALLDALLRHWAQQGTPPAGTGDRGGR